MLSIKSWLIRKFVWRNLPSEPRKSTNSSRAASLQDTQRSRVRDSELRCRGPAGRTSQGEYEISSTRALTRQRYVAPKDTMVPMEFYDYKVVLYRNQPDGWVAEIPAIPGCHALMTTREEALAELANV